MDSRFLVRQAARAGVSGLALGLAAGLVETILTASASRAPARLADVLLAAIVIDTVGFGVVGALTGVLVGLVATASRSQARLDGSGRLYVTAAVLSFFPLLALILRTRSSAIISIWAASILAAAGLAVAYAVWRSRTARALVPIVMVALVVTAGIQVFAPRQSDARSTAQASSAAPSTMPAGQRPNIILITVDTLRGDRLGACGDSVVRTPTVDRLASEAFLSCTMVTPQPATNATHASILTGASPNTHGIRTHMVDRLSPDVPTLPEILRNQGYATAGIYSWVSLTPAFSGLDRGFEYYEGFLVDAPTVLTNPLTQGLAAFYRRLKEYLVVFKTSEMVFNFGDSMEEKVDSRADVTTDAAIRWLDQRDARPFFLWVHYFDPHYPFTPPPPFDTAYDPAYNGPFDGSIRTVRAIGDGSLKPGERDIDHLVALYRGEIAFTDQEIGRFLDRVKAQGIWDNTIVVIAGDHGDSFGEHGKWFHPTGVYASETQIPLIIRIPGEAKVRQDSAAIASTDIAPTLLDILGLAKPETASGVSIVPLIKRQTAPPDRYVFSQTPDDLLIAVASARWKLIANLFSGSVELYDRAADPNELRDLAPQEAGIRDALLLQLRTWLAEQRIDPSALQFPAENR